MRTQTTPYTDQRKKTSSPFNAFVRDRILNLPREQMIGLPGDLTLHDWSRGFLQAVRNKRV